MADTPPTFKNQFLLSSKKCISRKSSHSVLSLFHFRVVLPRADSYSQIIVIYFSLKESIQAALLLRFLILQIFYWWVLWFNLLGNLRNPIIFAWGILVEICLVLHHVAVAHVFVLFDQLVLKILVKSIKDCRESLNSSRCITHRYCWWNLCYSTKLSHFWLSREITHLCRLLY